MHVITTEGCVLASVSVRETSTIELAIHSHFFPIWATFARDLKRDVTILTDGAKNPRNDLDGD